MQPEATTKVADPSKTVTERSRAVRRFAGSPSSRTLGVRPFPASLSALLFPKCHDHSWLADVGGSGAHYLSDFHMHQYTDFIARVSGLSPCDKRVSRRA